MPKYYRIDMGTGDVTSFESEAIPEIDKEALIIHESLVTEETEDRYPPVSHILEQDRVTRVKYLETFAMGDFGEGVRAKVDLFHGTPVKLIYSGVHVPHSTAIYDQLAKEQPDFQTWQYQAALGEPNSEGAMYLLSKEAGCMAHLAQHLPKEEDMSPLAKRGVTFATENLTQEIERVSFACGDKKLSFKMVTMSPQLTDSQRIRKGAQVGWDYGDKQWYARKMAPVLFHKADPGKVKETILIKFPKGYELQSLMLNKLKLPPAFVPIDARFLPKELVPEQRMTKALHEGVQRRLAQRSFVGSHTCKPRTADEAGEKRALIFCNEMKDKITQGDNYTEEAVFIVAKREQISEEPVESQQYYLHLKFKDSFDREGLLGQLEKLREIGMPHEDFSKMISEAGQINIPVDFLKELSITRTCLFMKALSPHLAHDECCRLQVPHRLGHEIRQQMTTCLAAQAPSQHQPDDRLDPDEETPGFCATQ